MDNNEYSEFVRFAVRKVPLTPEFKEFRAAEGKATSDEMVALMTRPDIADALEQMFLRSRTIKAVILRRAAGKAPSWMAPVFLARLAYAVCADRIDPPLRHIHPTIPPALGVRVLTFVMPADRVEERVGDLAEAFAIRVRRSGRASAEVWYWKEVLLCVASFAERLGWRLIGIVEAIRELLRQFHQH